MTQPRLSPATKALLRAAKSDAPGAAARAKIWAGVSSAAGGAAAGAGAAGSSGTAGGAGGAAVGATSAAKMLALGTLLGGTVTVGLAVGMLRIGPAPRPTMPVTPTAPVAAMAPAVHARGSPAGEPAAASAPAPASSARAPWEAAAAPASCAPQPPPAPVVARRATSQAAAAPATADDGLAREAALVAEARGALVRGEPAYALRLVRTARSLPSHQLAPEELAVEAQALRALGRDDDATEVDTTLRREFPESALAR